MIPFFAVLLFLCALPGGFGTQFLDKNLAYSSPFFGFPEVRPLPSFVSNANDVASKQFSRDTREIQARHIQHAKRQMESAVGFEDEHYPTFFGGDFSNVGS